MKRLFAITFIVGYLTVLAAGVVSHTLEYGKRAHPAMYYVVWDMFCGWNAYANQYRVVAQGESGKYYDASRSPWGDLYPHGDVERLNYDTLMVNAKTVALNYIRQTAHEPIVRVILVEEYWPKKYDFPDYLWNRRYDAPKERHSYFNKCVEFDMDGTVLREYPSWYSRQGYQSIYDNPRLLAEMRKSHQANSTFIVSGGGDFSTPIRSSSNSPAYPSGN